MFSHPDSHSTRDPCGVVIAMKSSRLVSAAPAEATSYSTEAEKLESSLLGICFLHEAFERPLKGSGEREKWGELCACRITDPA